MSKRKPSIESHEFISNSVTTNMYSIQQMGRPDNTNGLQKDGWF